MKIYKHLMAVVAGFALVSLSLTTATAQPSNDDCSGATALTVASSHYGCSTTSISHSGATTSTSPSSICAYSSYYYSDDIWFSFTAPASGDVQVNLTDMSSYSFGAAVYTSCTASSYHMCDNYSYGVGGSAYDDAMGETVDLVEDLTAGNTYYLRVWDNTSSSSTGEICVIDASAPSNDDCASSNPSYTLSSGSANCSWNQISMIGATRSSQYGCGSTYYGNQDVWIQFTATSSSVRIRTRNPVGSYYVGAAVYSSCSSSYLGCDSYASNYGGSSYVYESNAFSGLTVGNTYFMRVWSYNYAPASGSYQYGAGSYEFCLYTPPPPPSNDECSGAFSITPSESDDDCSFTELNTAGATYSSSPYSGCSSYYTDDDVWFSFVATTTSHTLRARGSSFYNYYLGSSLHTSCSSSRISYDCIGSNYVGYEYDNGTYWYTYDHNTWSGLTVGNTYYFRVFSYGSNTDDDASYICVYSPPSPPANDECSGAITRTMESDVSDCGYQPHHTENATRSTTPYTPCYSYYMDDDVWYKFTATASIMQFATRGPSTNTGNYYSGGSLHSSCSSSYSRYDCYTTYQGYEYINGQYIYTYASDKWNGLTIGNTYYLKVWANYYQPYYYADSSDGASICIYGVVPPPNDECSGALTVSSEDEPDYHIWTGLNYVPLSTSVMSSATYFSSETNVSSITFSGQYSYPYAYLYNSTGSVYIDLYDDNAGAWVNIHTENMSCSFCSDYFYMNGQTFTFPTIASVSALRIRSSGSTNYYYYPRVYLYYNPKFAFNNTNLACSTNEVKTTNATYSSSAGSACTYSYYMDDDVWFKFTAQSGAVNFEFSNFTGNGYAAGVAVYDACGGTLLECDYYVRENERSDALCNLTIGNTYYVRTWSYYIYQTSYDMCIYEIPVGTNDDACNPTTIPLNGSKPFTTICATAQQDYLGYDEISPGAGTSPISSCYSLDGWCSWATTPLNSVWFRFRAPYTGNVRITATGGNTQLALYDVLQCDYWASYTELGANDDDRELGSGQARLDDACGWAYGGTLTRGAFYYIQLTGQRGADVTGRISVDVIPAPVNPANEDCVNAQALNLDLVNYSTTTVSATTECASFDNVGTCGTSNTTSGVWYKFDGDDVSFVSINTCGPNTDYDTKLSVFAGTCGALACIDGNDDYYGCSYASLRSQVEFCAVPNTDVYILVHGYYDQSGDFDLNVTPSAPLDVTFNPGGDGDEACLSRFVGYDLADSVPNCITALPSGGSAPYSYQWSIDDGSTCFNWDGPSFFYGYYNTSILTPSTDNVTRMTLNGSGYVYNYNSSLPTIEVQLYDAVNGAWVTVYSANTSMYNYTYLNNIDVTFPNIAEVTAIRMIGGTNYQTYFNSMLGTNICFNPDPNAPSSGNGQFTWTYGNFDNYTMTTPTTDNVSGLSITSNGYYAYMHSHSSSTTVTGTIELYDAINGTWVQVYSTTASGTYPGSDFSNLSLTFPSIARVTMIRISASPYQYQAYHSFYNMSMELESGNRIIDDPSAQTICVIVDDTTTFSVVVTDANGCTTEGSVTINVVDVVCGKDSANRPKISLCHVPPGQVGKGTKAQVGNNQCVGYASIPAHVHDYSTPPPVGHSSGCTLGSCTDCVGQVNPDVQGAKGSQLVGDDMPSGIANVNAFPNPFSSTTNIVFTLVESGNASLEVYNTTGVLVANLFDGAVEAGVQNTVVFDASDMPTGVYLYKLTSGDDVYYNKVTLAK